MVSKVLQEVLDRLPMWPEHRQDAAAQLLLDLESQEEAAYGLSDEQVAEVQRRLATPNRRFVSLEDVRERFSNPRT